MTQLAVLRPCLACLAWELAGITESVDTFLLSFTNDDFLSHRDVFLRALRNTFVLEQVPKPIRHSVVSVYITFVEAGCAFVGSLFTIQTRVHTVRANVLGRLIKSLIAFLNTPVLVFLTFTDSQILKWMSLRAHLTLLEVAHFASVHALGTRNITGLANLVRVTV